jgi:hypothetical protein
MRQGEIEVSDLWSALRTAIKVPAVTNALGLATDATRANRVYLVQDVSETPKEATVWGRVIVVPVMSMFQIEATDSEMRDIRWLSLVEFAPYADPSWPVGQVMATIQRSIYTRWQGLHVPLAHAIMIGDVQLNRPAQDYPMRDDNTRMWYTSAEYVCRVGPKPT